MTQPGREPATSRVHWVLVDMQLFQAVGTKILHDTSHDVGPNITTQNKQ